MRLYSEFELLLYNRRHKTLIGQGGMVMARLVANKYVGVVLCLLLFLGVASAEDLKGAFSISPHVGGFHFDDNLDIDDEFEPRIRSGSFRHEHEIRYGFEWVLLSF